MKTPAVFTIRLIEDQLITLSEGVEHEMMWRPHNGYNKDTVEDLVKFVGTQHSFDCSMVSGLELAVYNSDHNEHRSYITHKSMSDTRVVECSRKSLENY
ncbi:hypothetical protein Tco_0741799 [Tanacetum coccineum]